MTAKVAVLPATTCQHVNAIIRKHHIPEIDRAMVRTISHTYTEGVIQ